MISYNHSKGITPKTKRKKKKGENNNGKETYMERTFKERKGHHARSNGSDHDYVGSGCYDELYSILGDTCICNCLLSSRK